MTPTLEQLNALEGLIPEDLGLCLAALAGLVDRNEAIVEIGSYKGKSTCYLATGSRGAHVYAVDPWDTEGNVTGRFGFAEPSTREAFDRQIHSLGLEHHVTALQGFSTHWARTWPTQRRIGLLYIDGDHGERSVREDFAAWEPHLATGALVAFDDCDTPRNPGVRVVVDELARGGLLECRIAAGRLAVGTYRG